MSWRQLFQLDNILDLCKLSLQLLLLFFLFHLFFALLPFQLVTFTAQLFIIWSCYYILIWPFCHDSPSLHDDDFISKRGKFNSMCWHHNCFPFQKLFYCLFYDELPYMHINCTQNIIQQQNIPINIQWSCKGNPCLLTTWYVDPLFSNLSFHSFWKHLQILFKTGIMQYFIKLRLINIR